MPFQMLRIVLAVAVTRLETAVFKFSHADFPSDKMLFQMMDRNSLTVFQTAIVLPLIFSQAPFAKPTTASRAPENIFLMPSQILFRAFFRFSKIALASFFRPSKSPVTRSTIKRTAPKKMFLMTSHTPLKYCFIPSQILSRPLRIFSNMFVTPITNGVTIEMIVSTIPCQMAWVTAFSPSQAVEAISVMLFQMPVKNDMIPFQTFWVVVETLSHAPEKKPAIPLHAVWVVSLIPFQRLE